MKQHMNACYTCRFETNISIHRHLRNLYGEETQACSHCAKSFATKSTELCRHIRTHSRAKPFTCSSRSYSINYVPLRYLTHTGEKPFVWSHCCKCFSDKKSLRIHFQTHTSEKLYKCSQCSTCCRHKSKLLAHLKLTQRRSHTHAVSAESVLIAIARVICEKIFKRTQVRSNIHAVSVASAFLAWAT